jgi:hypothetical protein
MLQNSASDSQAWAVFPFRHARLLISRAFLFVTVVCTCRTP